MEIEFTFAEKVFENHRRNAEEYEEIAKEIRRDIVKSLALAGSGHSGGSLGCADIISVLYFGGYMHYNPKNPQWNDRDRFVLSAGHICPVLYSALARAGFFNASELSTLRKYGSRLQGHPAFDKKLPGIECSTGSLGQGVSIAVGMAISDKFVDKNDRLVFTLSGDGEIEEGAVWEAAMAAANFHLDNLCWIVDNNDCQIDGRVPDVMNIYPIDKKFEAFNFNVITIDGNNLSEIIAAFDKFIQYHENHSGRPTVIIAKTKMGKGVTFMDDRYEWHGIPPTLAQATEALAELN